jgi:hypothetical protein
MLFANIIKVGRRHALPSHLQWVFAQRMAPPHEE